MEVAEERLNRPVAVNLKIVAAPVSAIVLIEVSGPCTRSSGSSEDLVLTLFVL
jgi:hypothetical protein